MARLRYGSAPIHPALWLRDLCTIFYRRLVCFCLRYNLYINFQMRLRRHWHSPFLTTQTITTSRFRRYWIT